MFRSYGLKHWKLGIIRAMVYGVELINGKKVNGVVRLYEWVGNVIPGSAATAMAAAPAPEMIPSNHSTLEDAKHHYTLIQSEKDLESVIEKIKKAGEFCFDTETTSLDPMLAELIAMTLSIKENAK